MQIKAKLHHRYLLCSRTKYQYKFTFTWYLLEYPNCIDFICEIISVSKHFKKNMKDNKLSPTIHNVLQNKTKSQAINNLQTLAQFNYHI